MSRKKKSAKAPRPKESKTSTYGIAVTPVMAASMSRARGQVPWPAFLRDCIREKLVSLGHPERLLGARELEPPGRIDWGDHGPNS